MTCQEISLLDVIGRADRILAEAEMGFRHAARFLRIVFKIGLNIHIRIVADNLDGVFVRANCTVRAEAPELAAYRALVVNLNGYVRQGQVRYVVDDAQGEVLLRLQRFHIAEYGVNRRRRHVLGRQAVAAGHDRNVASRMFYSSADVFKQRFA